MHTATLKDSTNNGSRPAIKTFQRKPKQADTLVAATRANAELRQEQTPPEDIDHFARLKPPMEQPVGQKAAGPRPAVGSNCCPGGLLNGLKKNRRSSILIPFAALLESANQRPKPNDARKQQAAQRQAFMRKLVAELVAQYAEIDAFELVEEDEGPSPCPRPRHRPRRCNRSDSQDSDIPFQRLLAPTYPVASSGAVSGIAHSHALPPAPGNLPRHMPRRVPTPQPAVAPAREVAPATTAGTSAAPAAATPPVGFPPVSVPPDATTAPGPSRFPAPAVSIQHSAAAHFTQSAAREDALDVVAVEMEDVGPDPTVDEQVPSSLSTCSSEDKMEVVEEDIEADSQLLSRVISPSSASLSTSHTGAAAHRAAVSECAAAPRQLSPAVHQAASGQQLSCLAANLAALDLQEGGGRVSAGEEEEVQQHEQGDSLDGGRLPEVSGCEGRDTAREGADRTSTATVTVAAAKQRRSVERISAAATSAGRAMVPRPSPAPGIFPSTTAKSTWSTGPQQPSGVGGGGDDYGVDGMDLRASPGPSFMAARTPAESLLAHQALANTGPEASTPGGVIYTPTAAAAGSRGLSARTRTSVPARSHSAVPPTSMPRWQTPAAVATPGDGAVATATGDPGGVTAVETAAVPLHVAAPPSSSPGTAALQVPHSRTTTTTRHRASHASSGPPHTLPAPQPQQAPHLGDHIRSNRRTRTRDSDRARPTSVVAADTALGFAIINTAISKDKGAAEVVEMVQQREEGGAEIMIPAQEEEDQQHHHHQHHQQPNVQRQQQEEMEVSCEEPKESQTQSLPEVSKGGASVDALCDLVASPARSAWTPLQRLLALCGQEPNMEPQQLPNMDQIIDTITAIATSTSQPPGAQQEAAAAPAGDRGRRTCRGRAAAAGRGGVGWGGGTTRAVARPAPVKVGEGSYGEAWRLGGAGGLVIKVVPIDGTEPFNGGPQQTSSNMWSETLVCRSISDLASGGGCDGSSPAPHRTAGFVATHLVAVCRGPYAPELVKAWQRWDKLYGSENQPVSLLPRDQLYWVIAMSDRGIDLEKYELTSWDQVRSVLLQVSLSLAVAEAALAFEHRDLHWGNVLVAPAESACVRATLRGVGLKAATAGVTATIIDFTQSRLTAPDGSVAYCDMAADPEIFTGPKGHIQFDTYRWMSKLVGSDWSAGCPATNCLWVAYLAEVMAQRFGAGGKAAPAAGAGAGGACVRLSVAQRGQLREFRKRALTFNSCSELVCDNLELFSGLLSVEDGGSA